MLVVSKVGSLLSMKMYYSGTVVNSLLDERLGHEKITGKNDGVDSTSHLVSRNK